MQAFLQMCNQPIKVARMVNAEYRSPSGKVPFIHVGNQVVSQLGPIVQFIKTKGYSVSDNLHPKAEMKACMELLNMPLPAGLFLWCDEATVGQITRVWISLPLASELYFGLTETVGSQT